MGLNYFGYIGISLNLKEKTLWPIHTMNTSSLPERDHLYWPISFSWNVDLSLCSVPEDVICAQLVKHLKSPFKVSLPLGSLGNCSPSTQESQWPQQWLSEMCVCACRRRSGSPRCPLSSRTWPLLSSVTCLAPWSIYFCAPSPLYFILYSWVLS